MRKAFTFIELIFVIVVIGILAKFGTNILMTTYTSYTASTVNNRLQFDSALALKQIANRLQYRIKDSVVASTAAGAYQFIASNNLGSGANSVVALEWIGYDIDGFLGNPATARNPAWSGFIDVNVGPIAPAPTTILLSSPGTDVVEVDNIIQALRANGSATTFANSAAIFFTGANSSATGDYGWGGVNMATQGFAAHRVTDTGAAAELIPFNVSTFAGIDVYENYKLAWTAYKLVIEDFDGDGQGNGGVDDLVLYYDYQPWAGDTSGVNGANGQGTRTLLLHNVDTFKFTGIGDSIQIEVCVNEQNSLGAGGYAVCKSATVF